MRSIRVRSVEPLTNGIQRSQCGEEERRGGAVEWVVDTGIAGGPLATWWGGERERGGAKGEGVVPARVPALFHGG